MSRGTRTGRRRPVRAPRQPHRGIDLHPWQPSEVPGVCASCPLSESNSVHDEAAIAAAEAERDAAQAEHQRRVGDR
ncbi:hypothetical protein Ait01nite_030450 [Actinoplanes italicus]|uniref:Uncharacterized protein n=1 Tax=Actinoplanes italicus TaxID=113567 RepID=A0A2T0KJ16_9ACTN|nr:hypothetical protein [Actinoplanes italicus]PRX23504.1 hypothetical protein CLV67_103252 [Actinoplanes italicus]GIE30000.1 hypothetical protein Ait01nite_030450 [Actinoplanes italicus]